MSRDDMPLDSLARRFLESTGQPTPAPAVIEAASRLHLYSGDTYVAFALASKADALRVELGRELESRDLVVGLGDGGGDVPMLRACSLGIYVGPPRDDVDGLAWTRSEGIDGSRGVLESFIASGREGATAAQAVAGLAPLLRGGAPDARADLARPFAPVLASDKDGTLTEKYARIDESTARLLAEFLSSWRVVIISSNESEEVIENLLEPLRDAARSPRDLERLVALTGNGLRRTVFDGSGFATARRPERIEPAVESFCFSLLAFACSESLGNAGEALASPRLKRWPGGDLVTLETDEASPMLQGRFPREVERTVRGVLRGLA